uniref:Uncharacterized protein n=1 Tax=Arundo donax TaxID=35708 RepID=A0A0A9GWE6_ARUDO
MKSFFFSEQEGQAPIDYNILIKKGLCYKKTRKKGELQCI